MKSRKGNRHLTIHKPCQPAFPNAADHTYFMNKAVDIVTAIVSGLGFISAMLFLLTMD